MLPNLTVLENLRLGMMAARRRRLGAAPRGGAPVLPAPARAHRPAGPLPLGRRAADARDRPRPGGAAPDHAGGRATEGLAPLLVQSLTDILREINKRGTTILLVEQTLEVAMALSNRLYVMDQGRIQFEGTPDALRRGPDDPAAVPPALAGPHPDPLPRGGGRRAHEPARRGTRRISPSHPRTRDHVGADRRAGDRARSSRPRRRSAACSPRALRHRGARVAARRRSPHCGRMAKMRIVSFGSWGRLISIAAVSPPSPERVPTPLFPPRWSRTARAGDAAADGQSHCRRPGGPGGGRFVSWSAARSMICAAWARRWRSELPFSARRSLPLRGQLWPPFPRAAAGGRGGRHDEHRGDHGVARRSRCRDGQAVDARGGRADVPRAAWPGPAQYRARLRDLFPRCWPPPAPRMSCS